jgi:hypothetical protein
MSKQINSLEFPELSKLLSQQFTSTEATLYKCQYCKLKVYKNAKGLAQHIKSCQYNKDKNNSNNNNNSTNIFINTDCDISE